MPHLEIMSNLNLELLDVNFSEMFANLLPGKNKDRW